jgi:hypothetical protein
MALFNEFVAIDPLALILPSAVYVRLVEKFHPHVPSVSQIAEAAKGITAEEKAFVLSRARILGAQAKAIEEAMLKQ